MTALIRAEALRLRSTRTFYGVTIGALVLLAVAVTANAAAGSFSDAEHSGRDALALAGLAQTFALVLGVIAVMGEFRHGTITPSLLITPRRTPLLEAKVVSLALGGLVFGLIAFAGTAAIALPLLSHRGIATQLDGGDVAAVIAGGTVATGLFAALGVGIGSVARNQVAAIVAALGLVYAVEPLLTFLPGVGDAVQRFGLGGLSSGAGATASFQSDVALLGQVPALLVLAGYALALLVAGATLLRRRDVGA